MFEVWFAPEGKGLVTIYMGTGPSILMIGLALHHLSLPPYYSRHIFILPFFLPCFFSVFYIISPFPSNLLTILFVNVGDVSP